MKNEKLRVTSAQIIVTGTKEKPYYEIKYREVGKEDYCIGYSSYFLDNVFEWLEECFDLVEDKNMEQRWIPVSERLPEEPKENEIFDSKPLELYLVSIKGDSYPFRAFWNGKFFTNGWQKCDVTAWMPLPEPYRESEVDYAPMTNADRIRSMTDEELAEWFNTVTKDVLSGSTWNKKGWLKWLKAESEEKDGE